MRSHGDAAPRARHRVPVRATPPRPAHPLPEPPGDAAVPPAQHASPFRPEERPLTEQDDTGTTLPLAEGFAPATAEQWWGLVGAVLRRSGGLAEAPDPATAEAVLSTTTYDGLRIRPLYTADDAAPDRGVPGVAPFVRGSRPTGRGTDGWDVRQRHADPDATRDPAGRCSTDLENGVTSLWLGRRRGRHARSPTCPRSSTASTSTWPRSCWTPAPTPPRRRAQLLRAVRATALCRPGRGRSATSAPTRSAVQARTGAAADLAALAPLASPVPAREHPRRAGADRRRAAVPRRRRLGRPGAGLLARRRRRLPAGADRAPGSTVDAACGAAGVPLRRHRRPVPDHRQAARRPPAVGPGRRGCAGRRTAARGAAPARRHLAGDDDPARPVGEHAAHHPRLLRRRRSAAPTRSPCCRSTPRSACRTRSPAGSPATPSRCCSRSRTWPG